MPAEKTEMEMLSADPKMKTNELLIEKVTEWRKGLLAKGPGEDVSRGRVTDRLAIPTIPSGEGVVKPISQMIDLASPCLIETGPHPETLDSEGSRS